MILNVEYPTDIQTDGLTDGTTLNVENPLIWRGFSGSHVGMGGCTKFISRINPKTNIYFTSGRKSKNKLYFTLEC